MLAVTELVFMRNDVDHVVHLVDIRPNPRRFFFDSRIDLRNQHDVRIDRTGVIANFPHEVSHGLDSKINPFTEIDVVEIA